MSLHEPVAFELPNQGKLTPEQNAFISGGISIFVAFWQLGDGDLVSNPCSIGIDTTFLLAATSGTIHFLAYLTVLKAFATISSTVVTPLMQLSAVWMLPLSTLVSLFGKGDIILPVHLLGVGLICAGGFLPAADGVLSSLLLRDFWQQSGVRYIVLSELLICIYNLIMHHATFTSANHDDTNDTLKFFSISSLFNGLTCMLLFAVLPSLRQHVAEISDVATKYFVLAVGGECLSTAGIYLTTFTYAEFYEPAVVNAVEGGLQQILNLVLAVVLYRVCGWGRPIDFIGVKLLSFVLVSTGLFLSAW